MRPRLRHLIRRLLLAAGGQCSVCSGWFEDWNGGICSACRANGN